MSGFKGQSGIEYLTTYGWMLVAVSVVGGTMYTQIDTGCRMGVDGFSGPFPVVDEVYQYENETLLLNVRNPDSDEIEVTEMVLREDGEEVGIIDVRQSINGEASENIYTNRFSSSENCVTRDIQINYKSGNLRGLTTNGTLTGKLALVPIKALFTANATFVDTNEEIKFNASRTEAESDIQHYNWTFGDGETAQGETVTHNYSGEAVYTVELTVEDEEGIVDTETKQIFVGGLLRRAGGNLSSLKVGESVITKCVGSACDKEESNDNTVATTDGDYLYGTLFTKELLKLNSGLCVTDYQSVGTDEGCETYRKGESNPVSPVNNEVYGSFQVPNIKPLEGDLCFGDCQ